MAFYVVESIEFDSSYCELFVFSIPYCEFVCYLSLKLSWIDFFSSFTDPTAVFGLFTVEAYETPFLLLLIGFCGAGLGAATGSYWIFFDGLVKISILGTLTAFEGDCSISISYPSVLGANYA